MGHLIVRCGAVIIILVVIAVLVLFGWMFDKKNLKELLLSKIRCVEDQ